MRLGREFVIVRKMPWEGSHMDVLVVVDMQNDFVSGALGTQEAFDIGP